MLIHVVDLNNELAIMLILWKVFFVLCFCTQVYSAGRPSKFDEKKLIEECIKLKDFLIRSNGFLAPKDDPVWSMLQTALETDMLLSSLFTRVCKIVDKIKDLEIEEQLDPEQSFDESFDESFLDSSQSQDDMNKSGDDGNILKFRFSLDRKTFKSLTHKVFYKRQVGNRQTKRPWLVFKQYDWETVIRQKIWDKTHNRCGINFKKHYLSKNGESGTLLGKFN